MSRKSKAAEFIDEVYNITITGRHVQITESMKDYAIEKISKVERFVEKILDVNITMDIQKLEHRVDISLQVNNIKIKSQAISDNMYASIDMAVRKLERQLLRYKARLREHQIKNGASVEVNETIFSLPIDDEINDAIESETARALSDQFRPHQILSSEKRTLRTLTIDEAIMKLELSGNRFLIFRGEEDHKLKVIYRRDDENLGVIEVEA